MVRGIRGAWQRNRVHSTENEVKRATGRCTASRKKRVAIGDQLPLPKDPELQAARRYGLGGKNEAAALMAIIILKPSSLNYPEILQHELYMSQGESLPVRTLSDISHRTGNAWLCTFAI